MPTFSFTTSQVLGFPSQIIFTDTTSGGTGSSTERRIYLRKSDGTFLVPTGISTQYIVWAINLPTLVVDALDKDYALQITVEWVQVTNTPNIFDQTFSIIFN